VLTPLPLRQSPYATRVAATLGADLALIGVAALVAWMAIGGSPHELSVFLQIALVSALGPVAVLAIVGRYDAAPTASVPRVIASALGGGLAGLGMGIALGRLHDDPLGPLFAAALSGSSFAICASNHFLVRWLLGRTAERVLIIGASDLGYAIAREVQARASLGLELVGMLSDDDPVSDELEHDGEVTVLGPVHHLEKIVSEVEIHRIVVASKSRKEFFPAEELLTLKTQGWIVQSGVDFYEHLTGKIYIRDLRPSYLVFSEGFRVGLPTRLLKRGIDVVLCGVGFLIAAPVLALCAVAIKLDSPGPVFFRQARVGRLGRQFTIRKLRSMREDAEVGCGPAFARRGDTRITRVGRLLRRSRLDELPQLWNVLRGDMTLVGPRPERPEFVDSLARDFGYFRLRTAMRPGLTGWAQVNNGYAAEIKHFEEKLSYDLFYLKHRSIALDLIVMLRTIREILLFKGV
jgi:exopolysaccharide biosynthesis polyprenyl glycosylphosphotransferase